MNLKKKQALRAKQAKARRLAAMEAAPEGTRVVKVGVFSVYLKK